MNQPKETLKKRELELQRLMRQMKLDELHRSKVYQNMEHELNRIRLDLITASSSQKEG
jgi:hypothetical protein